MYRVLSAKFVKFERCGAITRPLLLLSRLDNFVLLQCCTI